MQEQQPTSSPPPPPPPPPPSSQLFGLACEAENQGLYYLSYLPDNDQTPPMPEQLELANLLAECQRMSSTAALKISVLESEIAALDRFLRAFPPPHHAGASAATASSSSSTAAPAMAISSSGPLPPSSTSSDSQNTITSSFNPFLQPAAALLQQQQQQQQLLQRRKSSTSSATDAAIPKIKIKLNNGSATDLPATLSPTLASPPVDVFTPPFLAAANNPAAPNDAGAANKPADVKHELPPVPHVAHPVSPPTETTKSQQQHPSKKTQQPKRRGKAKTPRRAATVSDDQPTQSGFTLVHYDEDYEHLCNHYGIGQTELLVGDDYSRVKPPQNQVSLTTFWSHIEPWLRDLTEDDLRFLEAQDDDPKLYTVPPLGQPYQELWREQDQSAVADTMMTTTATASNVATGPAFASNLRHPQLQQTYASSAAQQALVASRQHSDAPAKPAKLRERDHHGSVATTTTATTTTKSSILFPSELYAAPLTERLLCALIATNDQQIKMLISDYDEEDLLGLSDEDDAAAAVAGHGGSRNGAPTAAATTNGVKANGDVADMDGVAYTAQNVGQNSFALSSKPDLSSLSAPNGAKVAIAASAAEPTVDVNQNHEIESLEERLKVELKQIGLLDDATTPINVPGANDEICEKLRALQRSLRSQVDVNRKRKRRLYDIASTRMGFQEYQHVLGDIDKQLEHAFQSRYCHKQSKKSKKAKIEGKTQQGQGSKGPPTSAPGGANGPAPLGDDSASSKVSSTPDGASADAKTTDNAASKAAAAGALVSNASTASGLPSHASTFPDNIRSLMEKRALLIREIGAVFLDSLLSIDGTYDRSGAASAVNFDDDNDVHQTLERRFWAVPTQSVFEKVEPSAFEQWRAANGLHRTYTLLNEETSGSTTAAAAPPASTSTSTLPAANDSASRSTTPTPGALE
ncbi:Transcriptional regulator [Sorochytrium milnesiophthora]